jgi:hypothetical protein
MAAIHSDVELMLRLKRTEPQNRVNVVSGYPACCRLPLESAQGSHFECSGCGDAGQVIPA